MVYRKIILMTLLCLTCITSITVRADDADTPMRELLLMQDILVVITPSKVEQSILESPSTITVLTREDIRRYGLNSFSGLMRNVAGMDVMTISSTDRNIGVRGFNRIASGRILSLVDSQPVYVSFYGATLWELMPLSMEDIERIEIIKGPGSALYGANAFDGIVNIITDPAPSNDSTTITSMVDQAGKIGGAVIHGGGSERLRYKASLGWDRISGWNDEIDYGGDNRFFRGSLRYSIDDISCFSLLGGIQNYTGDLKVFSTVDSERFDSKREYLRAQYDRADLKCSIFWDRHLSDPGPNGSQMMILDNNTLDFDLQHSFRPMDSNFVTWGVNYRFIQTDWEMLREKKDQDAIAGFVQDQMRLSSKINLTFGLRYDRHPIAGNSVSPRGSLVYSPSIGHAFRISAGRAFRNPPILYSYIHADQSIEMMMPMPINIEVRGNEDLSPEWITGFEVGYQGNFGTRLRGSVDIFHNKLDGLIEFDVVETYPENAIFPGSPGGVIPSVVSPLNIINAEARGGEIIPIPFYYCA